MNEENIRTGQAKVVLVISDGQRQLGTVTVISASAKNIDGSVDRLSCADGVFDRRTIKHYRKELLVILDGICRSCGIGYFDITLSAQNLQAASINDTHLEIDGFSADVSVFIAMLSAVFDMPAPQDYVFSGHISEGKILPVASLPIKLQIAEAAGIEKFYLAALNTEDSLASINKDELVAADNAIRRHRQSRRIQIRFVDNIFGLFEEVFNDSNILRASIMAGAFNEGLAIDTKTPADRIAQKICSMNTVKFRNCLYALMSKDIEQVYSLWNEFLSFYLNADRYPTGCGKLMYDFMCSVPPHMRRTGKIKFPFVEMELFAKLSQLAGEDNYDDLGLFFDGIRGKYLRIDGAAAAKDSQESDLDKRGVFDSVASSISMEYLDKTYGIKIDSARASFVLPSTTVESYEEFTGLAESFYNHLCGFTSTQLAVRGSCESSADQVYRLIERAFANKGGYIEARCRAIDGSHGGVRSVLDEITEQFRRDVYGDHTAAVFKRAIDMKNDHEKIAFITGALKRLKPFLTEELTDKPPQFLLEHTETLARVYVKTVDAVRQNMSRL